MPEHTRWLCLLSAILVVGCKSVDNQSSSSWFTFQQDRERKAAEFAASGRPAAGATVDESEQSTTASVVEAARSDSKSKGPAVAAARIDGLIEQGVKALREQRLQDAHQSFSEVVEAVPDHATAHHGLAMVADLSEDWADAEYHYKQALRLRPRHDGLLNDIGYSYLLQNRFHEASRYLNQAVEINPRHEKAHENLALLSLRQGNRDDAEVRLSNLYSPSVARQHLARLESRIHAADFTSPSADQQNVQPQQPQQRLQETEVPSYADLTFEEVQQLAARERMQAEQLRQQLRQQAASQDSTVNDFAAHAASSAGPTISPRNILPASSPSLAQSPELAQFPAAMPPAVGMQQTQTEPQQKLRVAGDIIPISGSGSVAHGNPQGDVTAHFPLVGLNAGPGALFPVGSIESGPMAAVKPHEAVAAQGAVAPHAAATGTHQNQPSSGAIMAPNPLSEYERQQQQLLNDYNQALQQLSRQSTLPAPVQARY